MSTSHTPAQIERFKREAKLLHRASSISHSQALDRIAIANGYSNWSMLMKHSEAHNEHRAKQTQSPLIFTRHPEQMRLSLLKVPDPRGWGGPTRSELAQRQVEDLSRTFVSPQNAVAFAISYLKCLLTVPRYNIHSSAPVYWEMRSWLPYGCLEFKDDAYILVNRHYKPVGQVGQEWANYEDFPHLRMHLVEDQRKRFTLPRASDAFLFNDGCPPWHSRADAATYLDRLQSLGDVLKG